MTAKLIEAESGLKAGEDYEVMRFDWVAAEIAFIDRQMDFLVLTTTVPSPSIHQYDAVSQIRLLGLSER